MEHLTTREIKIAFNFCHYEYDKLLNNDRRNADLAVNALNIDCRAGKWNNSILTYNNDVLMIIT